MGVLGTEIQLNFVQMGVLGTELELSWILSNWGWKYMLRSGWKAWKGALRAANPRTATYTECPPPGNKIGLHVHVCYRGERAQILHVRAQRWETKCPFWTLNVNVPLCRTIYQLCVFCTTCPVKGEKKNRKSPPATKLCTILKKKPFHFPYYQTNGGHI